MVTSFFWDSTDSSFVRDMLDFGGVLDYCDHIMNPIYLLPL